MQQRVFQAAPLSEWYRNAWLGEGDRDVWAYLLGFKQAADAVVDTALASGMQDYLVYPAAFAYRHAAELALKQSLVLAVELATLAALAGEVSVGDEATARRQMDKINSEHSLEKLRLRLKKVMSIAGAEPLPADISAMLTELHNIDPTGQSFRYSTGSDGRPSFPQPRPVDIARLKNLGKAVDFLCLGVCDWLSNAIQSSHEYLGELAAATDYDRG